MAISNYVELKEEIIDWSHRRGLDTKVDTFILLAEAEMHKENRFHQAIKLREMEKASIANVTTKAFAFPDGFEEARSMNLDIDTGNGKLLFKTPESIPKRTGTGRPAFFTATNQFTFDVTPDQGYDVILSYFGKPSPLSSTNNTNIILTNSPDVYLYGALWALFSFASDTEQKNEYYNLFSAAINGANEADDLGRYGPAPYQRIEGCTP